MPFNNDIAGGNGSLVRNWIQSQNYVAGSTGWRISKDGDAEFNNGTFRGSIEVGPLAGQHFIVNNPVTGDVVDVYNGSNQLVYSIDGNGFAKTIDPVAIVDATMEGGGVAFHINNVLSAGIGTSSIGAVNTTRQDAVGIFAEGHVSGATCELQLWSGSDDGSTSPEYTILNQAGVTGSVMQNDTTKSNNLFHMGGYTGTTDAAGALSIAHGASFTPRHGCVTGTAPGGSFANLTHGLDGFTATNINTNWKVANTGAAFANSIITFDAIMWR